jgi:hypothetical protein
VKCWVIEVSGKTHEHEVSSEGSLKFAKEVIKDWPTLTRVEWRGKLRHMAVADNGYAMGMLPNDLATMAYLKACRPGVHYVIVGTVVIFEEQLK